MFKKTVLPAALLAAGGLVVALAVGSVRMTSAPSTASAINPCAPRPVNPCAAKRALNPCAPRAANPCRVVK